MKFKSRRNNQNKETLEEFTGEIEVIEEEQTLDELISPDFDEIEYYDEDLNQIEAPKKEKNKKEKE